jgi:hypothetical protein
MVMSSDTIKVRIYECAKHPKWSLETTTPVMVAGLKVFCPLCRDEFLERSIGVASVRTEERQRRQAESDRPQTSNPDLFK